MLNLTKHFVKNWKIRVGGNPNRFVVNDVIRESVRQTKGRIAFGRWGGMDKSLTVYCHFPLGLSFLVDHYSNNVVSVSSWKNMPENYKYKSLADIVPGAISKGGDHEYAG
jgi:hypothetical protein